MANNSLSSLPTSMDLEVVTPEQMALHVPPNVQFVELSSPNRRVAYRHLQGKSPTLLYVPGFLSTMEIYKAVAMEQFAQKRGYASLRYDQSSTGQTTGVKREDAGTDVWMRDALAMVDLVAQDGPIILVASSNGGWVSTYVASVRPERIAGLVLIGPSYNYPHLRYEESISRGIMSAETLERLNRGESLKYQTPYGEGFFSLKAMEESKKYVLLFENGIKVKCPIRLLHALGDEDVEWRSSLRLLESLESPQVDLILRKSGNHRLMKPQDLTLLTFTLDRFLQEYHTGTEFLTPDERPFMAQNKKQKSKL